MAIENPGIIKCANDILIEAQGELNKYSVFGTDYSDEFADAGDTVKVGLVATQASTFNLSSNNYETNDGNITWSQIELGDPLKSTMKYTQKELTQNPAAPWYQKCSQAGKNAIAGGISEKIANLFDDNSLSANDVALTAITKKSLAGLRKECKAKVKNTVLILSESAYADMLSLYDANIYGGESAVQKGYIDSGLYGFARVVEGIGFDDLHLAGALVPTDALGFASRNIRIAVDGMYQGVEVTTDPESGLTMTTMIHGDPATNSGYVNNVTLFGGKILKKDEVVRLTAS